MDDFPEFETYADVIDAYERDSMGYPSLTDYIKGNNIKIKEIDINPLSDLENLRNGGPVGIEILFTEKVPAAPSQLVSESDILLGYRGDAAYRSGSEQSKSIGQGNVGSKQVLVVVKVEIEAVEMKELVVLKYHKHLNHKDYKI